MAFGRAFYEPIFKLIRLEKINGHAVTLGVVSDAFVPADILKRNDIFSGDDKNVEFREAVRKAGIDKLSYLDVSDFEGAEIIQDLSVPIDPDHIGIADLVLDNGTIEHCANPLQAIGNVNSLLREGGVALFMSPSNGYLDHGFWQISPTLYFDLFYDLGYEILFLYVRASHWERHDRIAFDYRGIAFHSDQDHLSWTFPRALTFCAVRKRSSDVLSLPIQSFYSVRHRPRYVRDFTKIKYRASEIADVTTIDNRDLVGPNNFLE